MTTATATPQETGPTTPGGAFHEVMTAALGAASAKVDAWTSKLNDFAAGGPGATEMVDGVADEVAEGGGAKQQAGTRGVQAGLEGKNPVWAAIKGAWAGGSPTVKAAVVASGVALILLLLLSPVLLVVVLLAVPIIVLISKARSKKK